MSQFNLNLAKHLSKFKTARLQFAHCKIAILLALLLNELVTFHFSIQCGLRAIGARMMIMMMCDLTKRPTNGSAATRQRPSSDGSARINMTYNMTWPGVSEGILLMNSDEVIR
jgi:hypothetical protein